MRKTLLQLLTFVLCITGMQNPLLAQEQTPLNQVVNTLKERISLAGYAQLGYTYDDAAKPDNTFDIKRIIFMAHGKITKRWTCDFMYDFYNGGMLLDRLRCHVGTVSFQHNSVQRQGFDSLDCALGTVEGAGTAKADVQPLCRQLHGILGAAGIAMHNALGAVLFKQGVDVCVRLPVVHDDGLVQFQRQPDLGFKQRQLGVLRHRPLLR